MLIHEIPVKNINLQRHSNNYPHNTQWSLIVPCTLTFNHTRKQNNFLWPKLHAASVPFRWPTINAKYILSTVGKVGSTTLFNFVTGHAGSYDIDWVYISNSQQFFRTNMTKIRNREHSQKWNGVRFLHGLVGFSVMSRWTHNSKTILKRHSLMSNADMSGYRRVFFLHQSNLLYATKWPDTS